MGNGRPLDQTEVCRELVVRLALLLGKEDLEKIIVELVEWVRVTVLLSRMGGSWWVESC